MASRADRMTILKINFIEALGKIITDNIDQVVEEKRDAFRHMAKDLEKICKKSYTPFHPETIKNCHINELWECASRFQKHCLDNFDHDLEFYTTFCIESLESSLDMVKDQAKKQALENVYDMLLAINLYINPDYDDSKNIDMATEAYKVFSYGLKKGFEKWL